MTPASDRRPIGVFDSGVGGLTVLRALLASLPDASFVYFGDTARVPWGTKGASTVERYSVNIAHHLAAEGCQAIVIACNTASAFAVDAVQQAVDLPVVDVIRPVCRQVAYPGANGALPRRIGVLGTRGTIGSGAYVRALHHHLPDLDVVQQPCPLFVPLVEEGWLVGDVPERIIRKYLEPILSENPPEALILGCTHYPLLARAIAEVSRSIAGEPIPLHESGLATARALSASLDLATASAATTAPLAGRCRFQVTDAPELFLSVASRFLGEEVAVAEHVDLKPPSTSG